MAEPSPPRTYSQEEVTEILKRALRQQSLRSETLSHDELVQMAGEVGIDRDAIEAATADLAQTRAEVETRDEESRELARERERRFTRFVSSLFTFVIIGTFLYFVDHRTGAGGSWFYWTIAAFGIALAFQLRSVFFPHEGLERRRRHERKREHKLARRAEREERRGRFRAGFDGSQQAVDAGAKQFEAAVQAGVAALLDVAARKIQAHAERSGRETAAGPRARR